MENVDIIANEIKVRRIALKLLRHTHAHMRTDTCTRTHKHTQVNSGVEGQCLIYGKDGQLKSNKDLVCVVCMITTFYMFVQLLPVILKHNVMLQPISCSHYTPLAFWQVFTDSTLTVPRISSFEATGTIQVVQARLNACARACMRACGVRVVCACGGYDQGIALGKRLQ